MIESIYNFGKGGGLEYGGILEDSDYIKIENNKIYEYNNLNRPNLNFVLEAKSDTAFFGAIQINTDVNTNVYVYELKNGLYYLLGCIGGRSISAGDSVKTFILGDSYEVQTLTETKGMKYFVLGGEIYELVKIGNRYWTKTNAVCEASDLGITSVFPIGKPAPQATYKGFFYSFSGNDAQYQQAKNKLYPFRIPLESDYIDLIAASNNQCNKIMATGWANFPNANNETGFSCTPCGSYSFGWGISLQGQVFNLLFEVEDSNGHLRTSYNEGTISAYDNAPIGSPHPVANGAVGNLRFCIDA